MVLADRDEVGGLMSDSAQMNQLEMSVNSSIYFQVTHWFSSWLMHYIKRDLKHYLRGAHREPRAIRFFRLH